MSYLVIITHPTIETEYQAFSSQEDLNQGLVKLMQRDLRFLNTSKMTNVSLSELASSWSKITKKTYSVSEIIPA